MKKLFSFLMFVAVTATTLVGCIDTQIDITDTPTLTPTTTGVYRQLTFSSDATDESRTHHNGTTIVWSPGDRIRIGYTKDGVWQNAEGRSSHEDSKTAKLYASDTQTSEAECSEFRVTQLFKDTEAEGELTFYGLYPSEITKGNNPDFANSESGTINVVLPQIQTPSATSFDSKADLLVSHSRHNYDAFPSYKEHIKMLWTRLVTHGMITIKNLGSRDDWSEGEKIQYVEFTADADDALTGDFVLDIDGKELTAKNTAKNKVRLSFTDNAEYNTLFDADNDGTDDDFVVWFATAPFTATNLTVKVGTDKATYTRTFVNANKTFPVNVRYSLGISMANATREDIETGEEWRLLTDVSFLAAGKKIVIAAAGYNVAMSAPSDNGNNRKEATITKNDDSTITIGEDTRVFILRAGIADNTWAFYDEDKTVNGFLCAASNGSNYLKTQSTLDANGSWAIEVTPEGIATVKAQGTYTRNWMRYNKTSTLFSAYGTGQEDIALYYNAVALETLETPVIDDDATELPEEGNSAQITWNPVENALYYTVTCKCEGQDDVVFNNITDTTYLVDNLAAGQWSITVTAHADGYSPATSAPITVDISDPTPSVTAEPTELIFTAAGGVKNIIVKTKNLNSPTITAVSDNATINNWISVSGSTVTVNAPANNSQEPISGTITITATEGETAVTATVSVRQTAKSPATAEWQLLTDISSLEAEGLEVVIAAADYNVAMSTTQNTNNRGKADITKSDDKSTITIGDDTQIFLLGAGADTDTWSFFDETYNNAAGGYLYAASTSANQLKTRAELNKDEDGQGSWAITIENGVTSIVAQGAETRNVMQYNSNSGSELFSCYEIASQKPVAIYYRLASTEPRILLLEVDNNEIGQAADSKITVTVTTKYAAGETVTAVLTDSNGNPVGSGTATITEENTAQFTITANNANDNPEPRELTLTVSLNNGSSKSVNIAQAGKPVAGANETDYIDREFTGVAVGTSYADWSGKEGASGAIYAGQSAGSNNTVQLRSNNSNSGIVTTKSAGKVTRVVINWNSGTDAARAVSIYGKNSAYSAATDLYNANTQGDHLGDVALGTTEFIIEGDYAFIGLRSKSGALYLNYVQIVWGDGGENAPTTPAPELNVTQTEVSVEAAGGSASIDYTVANPTTGVTVSASTTANWISSFDYSQGGKVTFDVAENTSTEAREAVVTIAYEGATSKEVTVTQAGATQSGGDDTGSTEQWARVTSLNDITAGTYAIICGDFILLNNSGSSRQAVTTYASKGITITNNTIASVPTECQWAFAGNNTAMTLSPVDDATKYLYSTKSGDGLRISTTHDTWSFSTGATANCFYIKDANMSVHLAVYNNQDWRSYTSATQAQSNMQLYKKTGGNSGGDTPVEPETPATPTQLATPSVTASASGNTVTVSWGAITGAKDYTVKCGTQSKDVTGTSTSFTGLEYSTKYDVSVVANPSDANANTASEEGTATATTEADPNAGGGATSTTVEMSSFTATSASMDTNISYSTAKGGGTSNPAINTGQIRLYQNSAGTGGGTITITAANGATLSSVTIGSGMATSIAYTIGSSTTKSTTASLAKNGKYTVNDINATSITFYCMGTTSTTRLYVNYLSVTYNQ